MANVTEIKEPPKFNVGNLYLNPTTYAVQTGTYGPSKIPTYDLRTTGLLDAQGNFQLGLVPDRAATQAEIQQFIDKYKSQESNFQKVSSVQRALESAKEFYQTKVSNLQVPIPISVRAPGGSSSFVKVKAGDIVSGEVIPQFAKGVGEVSGAIASKVFPESGYTAYVPKAFDIPRAIRGERQLPPDVKFVSKQEAVAGAKQSGYEATGIAATTVASLGGPYVFGAVGTSFPEVKAEIKKLQSYPTPLPIAIPASFVPTTPIGWAGYYGIAKFGAKFPKFTSAAFTGLGAVQVAQSKNFPTGTPEEAWLASKARYQGYLGIGLGAAGLTSEALKLKPYRFDQKASAMIKDVSSQRGLVERGGTIIEQPSFFGRPYKQTLIGQEVRGRVSSAVTYRNYQLWLRDFTKLLGSEYTPKPFSGPAFGYSASYGFGKSLDAVIGRAQATKQYQKALKILQRQGYTPTQARSILKTTFIQTQVPYQTFGSGIISVSRTSPDLISTQARGEEYLVPFKTKIDSKVQVGKGSVDISVSKVGKGMTRLPSEVAVPELQGTSFRGFVRENYSPSAFISTKAQVIGKPEIDILLRNPKIKSYPGAYKTLLQLKAKEVEGLNPRAWLEYSSKTNAKTGLVEQGVFVKEIKPTLKTVEIYSPKGEIIGTRMAAVDTSGRLLVTSKGSVDTLNYYDKPFSLRENVQQRAFGVSGKRVELIGSESLQTAKSGQGFKRVIYERAGDGMFKRTTYTFRTEGEAQIGANVGELVSQGRITPLKTEVKFVSKYPRQIELVKTRTPEILTGVKKGEVSGPLAITRVPEGKYNVVQRGNEFFLSQRGKIDSPFKIYGEDKAFRGITIKRISKSKPFNPALEGRPAKINQGSRSGGSSFFDLGGGGGQTTQVVYREIPVESSGPFSLSISQASNILRTTQLPVSTITQPSARTVSTALIMGRSSLLPRPIAFTFTPTVTAQVPVATPVLTPIITPTQTPTEIPTVTPTTIPTTTTTPVQTPIITPTVVPTITPVVTPTIVPVITPVITPTNVPVLSPFALPQTVRQPSPFVPSRKKRRFPAQTKRRAEQGYLVLTKKRKRDVLISPQPLEKGQALALGLKYTKATERATFKLVPTTREPVRSTLPSISELQVFKAGYRPPIKKGRVQPTQLTFIQKKPTRLGTRKEVVAVQSYKGRSKIW